MRIQISDHFTYGKLLRFTLPSIGMMVFTSLYGIVDGYFVSNYAGKIALGAVNLAWPVIMMFATVGLMVGAGASALIAKTLGQGEREEANRIFSLFIWFDVAVATTIAVIGYAMMPRLMAMMGAKGELLEMSTLYGRILCFATTGFSLQNAFQTLFSTAGRPQTGLLITIAGGLANMALDWLFVGVWRGGLVGAALATLVCQIMLGVIPLIYFLRPNPSTLRIGKTRWMGRALRQGCLNGISELLSQVSMSVIGMLFNAQLLRIAGENGVAAYSVLMYLNFVFISAFLGYAMGTNPIVGYSYGAQEPTELRNVLRKSLVIMTCFGAVATLVGEAGGEGIARFFVGYDAELLEMTRHGFTLYSLMFLFCGYPIFLSSFFTGLNNGLVSAVISVARTLVFEVTCVLVLPEIIGLDGIWISTPVAELSAAVIGFIMLGVCRRKYGY